jgi:protein-S-isoprenylcysteine O-methyltransferase Ste14
MALTVEFRCLKFETGNSKLFFRFPLQLETGSRKLFLMNRLFVLVRAVIYATLFIGLVLVYVPSRLLPISGIARAPAVAAPQIAGLVLATLGGALALWCIVTFIFVGQGTPAPFDPPRRLVIRGPYHFVRNPMYLGACGVVAGAALYYRSLPLLAYGCALLIATHLLVVFYEEPTLTRQFGQDYEAYRQRVKRWLPRFSRSSR